MGLETERDKRLAEVYALARQQGKGAGAEEAAAFVRAYYARVSAEDIAGRPADALCAAALSLWEFAAQRQPGRPKIRAFNPAPSTHGWSSDHSVVEIVNDDMPFLVDSTTMALRQHGVAIHSVIHPIVAVRRDASGARLALAPAAGDGATPESTMHIEVDRQSDPRSHADLVERLQGALADVRAAVEDWRPMTQRLRDCMRALDETPPPLSAEEVAEGRDLLEWMGDNHFTFLGYREVDYGDSAGGGMWTVVPGSGFGILRDPARRIMRATAGAQGAGADVPPEVYRFMRRPELIIVLKANVRSTVHRPVHLDYVAVKRFDAAGKVVGERRFAGLFTSAAYNRNPREIPYLRRKVRRVMEGSGLAPGSHDGKALQNVLDTYPRDELFQIGDDDLARIAGGILHLQERPRIRLFVRRDDFRRFVSCLVYVPREQFTTTLRRRYESILAEAFGGHVAAHYTQVGDEALARLHVIISTTPSDAREADVEAVEAKLVRAARTWRDDLFDALIARHGEEAGNRLWLVYADAFPGSYSETFDAEAALFDIAKIEQLRGSARLDLDLYRPADAKPHELRAKIYRAGEPVSLSDCLPVLEKMGLKVLVERPFHIEPAGTAPGCWIHDFGLLDPQGRAIDLGRAKAKFEDAFAQVWSGAAENDGFNRLVLWADLNWREVACLRAFAKYLRQAGFAFSQAYMEDTLVENAGIARLLMRLFDARFNPAGGAKGDEAKTSAAAADIEAALEKVASLDQDRILRRFLNLAQATVRTNFYQTGGGGEPRPAMAFKFESAKVAELPAPRPWAEIFVYSPKVEGVHLRGGTVARGGIRWSDRREDFRTEILGLLKAQMVKNAVIVPVGAKGGFIPKRPPTDGDREAVLADGVACYKTFVGALLDLTDNLAGGRVAPPSGVVRHDGDDPYLVVAADKGTATFSDIANGLARERGFWLDDAFASGGSSGYDHKKMAITARGAWELVKRHFRELGRDIQAQAFTVVGVGDMSGDVFGNAMLLSPHIRLVGAFDHRHVFIDPDPDLAASLRERQRLFALPRSSWADYDAKLISKGGGIYERKAKAVKLSPAAKALFDIEADSPTPAELIRAMLRADVDLLWFGGIGTFVKASDETATEVGDRANDTLRVDGRDIRAKVVGEGGNLACTQRGRVEYALKGGRLNTDAVDNSGGVDCSDHEVNIKILLNAAVAEKRMTAPDRDKLLAEMTEEVAALVLRDNYLQGQAISLAVAEGHEALERHARQIRALERAGRLDRALEYLPDEDALAERRARQQGLTRPELAVLMAYAKTSLYDDLLASDLPDDTYFAADLERYFPRPLRQRLRDSIPRHRLRREIIATGLANSMVNRLGIGVAAEIQDETQAPVAALARATAVAREAFSLRPLWSGIEALDNKAKAATQFRALKAARDLHRRAVVWLLRHRANVTDVKALIEEFAPGVAALSADLAGVLPDREARAWKARQAEHEEAGMPAALAEPIAALPALASAFDVVAAARMAGQEVKAVARVYFGFGHRLGIDWLREGAAAASAAGYWERQALAAVVEDLYARQREVTAAALAGANGAADPVEHWIDSRRAAVDRFDRLMDEFRHQGALDLARLALAERGIAAAAGAA
jgi:glutamate dehydrogenase